MLHPACPTQPSGKPGETLPSDWKSALHGAAIGCLLALLVLWPATVSLTQVWRSSNAYQFAWLILPLLVYLLGWHHRPATLRAAPRSDLSGVFVAIAAALCWVAAELVNIDAARQFALILAVQGICMAALGWRSYWRLAPILWLMFLMVPSGDLFQPLLRLLTVKVIMLFAMALDLPHQINGFQIRIGDNDYIVLKECAGLPYFLLASFLGYAFGLLLYRSFHKILAVALLGALLGILTNALRVCGIVLIDWLQSSQMPLSAHANVQWVALALCLGLLFFILGRLNVEPPETADAATGAQPGRHSVASAPILAGLAILVIAGGASWSLASAVSVPKAAGTEAVPEQLAGWHLVTPHPAWSVNAAEGKRVLMATYRRDRESLIVRIVESATPTAKLLDSDVAPGNTGIWHENSITRQTVCAESTCMEILHTTWEHGQSEERRHVYSTYALGTFRTTSKLALRTRHGWARLSGDDQPPRLIGLTLDAAASPEQASELAQIFRALQPSPASAG